jgi:hypothetical protein
MSGWQKAGIFLAGSLVGGLALAFIAVVGIYLARPELLRQLQPVPTPSETVELPAAPSSRPSDSLEAALPADGSVTLTNISKDFGSLVLVGPHARDVLAQVVEDNPGCFEFTDELDLEHNGPLYLDLLVKWHSMLDTLETAWRAEDAESHLWVAVIPDVRAFVFSTNGLAGHLDQIGFALTNDEFVEALQKAATGE